MDIFDDIFRLTSFETVPLAPYIKMINDECNIYYLFVIFSDTIEEGKMIIKNISLIGHRCNEKLEYFKFDKPINYPIIVDFGIDKIELYQNKTEQYCLLINDGKIKEAIDLYNNIVPDDLKKIYEDVIRGIYE